MDKKNNYKMRILHINTYQTGGAALCALRISNALRDKGINSCFVAAEGNNSKYINVVPEDKYNWSKSRTLRFVQRCKYIIKPLKTRKFKIEKSKVLNEQKYPIFTTLPCNNYKNLINHPWIKEADIIHLHWIANFIDFKSFFKHINKPIVWTLHDENPLMGCFHYTNSYKLASQELIKFENKCIKYKQKALKNKSNINIIAISKSMEKQITQNSLLKKYKCTLINNGVDINKFERKDKNEIKTKLGLTNYNKIFLFSAFNIHEKRKGLKELIEALEKLNIPNSILICIGNYNEIPKTAINIKCVGFINDENELSKYYSAADYFVMPSYQEAFAQTPLEAMSCGTPVIAFPCSGTEDLVKGYNGVICNDFTVDALIEGIKVALTRKNDSNIIRKYIEENFSYDIIAQKYIDLYQTILNENGITESKEPFSVLDDDFYKQQNLQKEQAKNDNKIFDKIDKKKEIIMISLKHPRFFAGWIKSKIFK